MAAPVESGQVLQAWMLAIPSVLTALSAWYTNRKTTKTVTKSDEKTKGVVEDASVAVNKELANLKAEVAGLKEENKKLTAKVEETRQCQVNISQKHTETMNEVHAIIRAIPRTAKESVPAKSEVKTVEVSPQPLGKVTWKKDE